MEWNVCPRLQQLTVIVLPFSIFDTNDIPRKIQILHFHVCSTLDQYGLRKCCFKFPLLAITCNILFAILPWSSSSLPWSHDQSYHFWQYEPVLTELRVYPLPWWETYHMLCSASYNHLEETRIFLRWITREIIASSTWLMVALILFCLLYFSY